MKKLLLKTGLILICLIGHEVATAQCFPGLPTTAAFATGGTSPYKNQVLWLTWGSLLSNITTYPYGRHAQKLVKGSASYASIDVGGGRYLCIKAVISDISKGDINSYAPGNYSGDSMDDMYNIGGTETKNKLVSGIRNITNDSEASFTISCTATLNGNPIKLSGMVIGDAESLASGDREYFNATADGEWSIVDLQKNLDNRDSYKVRKVNVSGSSQRLEFQGGNDDNTAAVAFLKFNESAFSGSDLSVKFNVTLKGGGLTAIALGLLPVGVDGGDAPASYGSPLHVIDHLALSDDHIPVGTAVNLNTSGYKPGGLVPSTTGFLGSKAPDTEPSSLFSKDAMGDNNNGAAGILEEDAWPATYKSFSYKAYYMPGDIIKAVIPYKGADNAYISGWIDFNQNGVFDVSEIASADAPATRTSVTLSWTVPSKRVIRSTYVRLRYAKNKTDVLSPISYTPGGEIEDHRIYIQGPAITNPMLPSKGGSR